MEFDEVAGELYGLPPEQFVAVREQLAKQARSAGDRQLATRIHGLRRPTLAAWAVNLLVREQPQTCDDLISLGGELRQAWAAADGPHLQELSARRREVVYAIAQLVRRLAYQHGHPLGDDAAEDVQATLDAALADPAVAREVCSGRLDKARSYAGFGPVDRQPAGEGEVAVSPAPAAPRTRAKAAQSAAQPAERPAPGKRAAGTGTARGRAADRRAADERAAAERAEERRRAEERAAAERRRAERERLAADARYAEAAAEAAEADLAEAVEAVARAEQRRDEATAEIERLTEEIEAARIDQAEARRAVREAGRERGRLEQRASGARRRANQAQALLAAAGED